MTPPASPTGTPNPTSTPTPILIAILALSAPLARADLPPAQPHGYQSLAEKAEVRLGEPFAYSIQVRHDPADSYELSGTAKLEPFEAGEARCAVEPGSAGEAVTTCRMRLALYELGDHDVPDVRLVAHGPGGDRLLVVPGPRVHGVGVIDPTTKAEELRLRDLAPQAAVMVRSWRLAWWALALLAAAALAWAGRRAWRLRRARATAPTAAVALPPHLRFERRLSELEAERLTERSRRREFFFRLSEVVREYLGALHGINALDLTTSELVEAIARHPSPALDHRSLLGWCQRGDMVKFARLAPSDAECAAALAWARELLDRTRPRPEAAA